MESIKLTIPTSWDDITVGQFIELQPVLNSDLKLIKKVNSILSVLSGTPVDDLQNVVASDNNIAAYRKIAETLAFMNDTSTMEEVKGEFKVGGKWYSLNLNVEAMDAGQYISLMEILKRANSDPQETLNHTHEILACVIHEIKGKWYKRRAKYDAATFQETAELFYKELPISIAYPITVFFCKVWRDCITSLQAHSLVTAEQIMEEVKKDLATHGVGL